LYIKKNFKVNNNKKLNECKLLVSMQHLSMLTKVALYSGSSLIYTRLISTLNIFYNVSLNLVLGGLWIMEQIHARNFHAWVTEKQILPGSQRVMVSFFQ
jgi:hypothetical protein